MNDKELLSLMTEDESEFRGQSLEQTLRVVRHRRRVRRGGQVLAALAILGVGLWWCIPRPATSPGSAVVKVPEVQSVNTTTTSLQTVSTRMSSVEFIGDDELLQIVPGEIKLLVWHAPHKAELVILDVTQ